MGHDVLISNLWEVRNFWEWLAPGYVTDRVGALSGAAFVPYDRLSSYHDFIIQKEDGSTANNVRVGLWAKRYMSDDDDTRMYLGTLVTKQMFDKVVGQRIPEIHVESRTDQKRKREDKVLKKLIQVTKGDWKEQFSAERLADAMALCRRDWAHFDNRPGSMPEDGSRSMLPRELGAALQAAGKRQLGMARALPRQAVPLDGNGPDLRIGGPVQRKPGNWSTRVRKSTVFNVGWGSRSWHGIADSHGQRLSSWHARRGWAGLSQPAQGGLLSWLHRHLG